MSRILSPHKAHTFFNTSGRLAKRILETLYRTWVHQLVIPPLSREGGVRCSVKPASRIALHFRDQLTNASAQVTWPNSQLGVGKPATATQWTSQVK
ncbi:hypothetical protein LguiA_033820 [Lonicera macranthoides]